MKITRSYTLTIALLALWFAAAITASALHIFKVGNSLAVRLPLLLGIFVTLPILVFLIGYLASRSFREFVLSLDPRILTLAQAWRIGGITFVILQSMIPRPLSPEAAPNGRRSAFAE